MQNMSNVGNAEPDGLQHSPQTPQPLERLRPFQIAIRILPTVPVTVMEATDEQFQALIDAHGVRINDTIAEWSFDDRCRFINHKRRQGIDLFVLPNKNSSESEQKQLSNNSETIPDSELFIDQEAALRALANVSDEEITQSIGDVCSFVLGNNENNS